MEEDDDAWLRSRVESARGGDVDAWEWLYRRMYPRLYSFARRRLSNDHGAADAVSETMTRALVKIDGFEWRGAGFEAWLFGICRNVVSESRRASLPALPVGTIDAANADPLTPAEAAESSYDRATLANAFARLDPAEQEILELRIVAELTAEATGEVVGKQAGAVRMAQSRALARLRTFFVEVTRD